MTETMNLHNGIRIHQIYESKFNEVLVNLKISFPLKPYQNTMTQLLIRMLGDRTATYPTKKLMQERLDTMYGASVRINSYALGENQIIDMSVKAINSEFVKEDLLELQCELLAEFLYNPLFNESLLNEAKRDLLMYHSRIKENTASYAQIQAFKNAAKGQVFEINSIGEADDVLKVSLEELKDFHQLLVNSFAKDIYIVGHQKSLDDFSMFSKGHGDSLRNSLNATVVEPGYLEQSHAGNQTELIQVYSTDIDPHHELYEAYLVFVAILGQLPSSYLFRYIREEQSLAYRIFASRQVFDGVMYIGTSISDKNLELTQTLIKEQFDKIANEDIEILGAIEFLSSNLQSTSENLKSIGDFSYRNEVLQDPTTIEGVIEKIQKVTIEQVKEVLNHISEPFIFAYRGDKHE